MAVPCHDVLEPTPIDGLARMVEVERACRLDRERFDEGHGRAPARIPETLPGAVRHRDVPWWSGDDEAVPPFRCTGGVP